MPELREIIYRLRMGRSIREIRRETGTHRTIIREMLALAEKRNWLKEGVLIPSESEIKKALEEKAPPTPRAHPLDEYLEDIKRWHEEGYTFVVMQRLLEERYKCDESTVRRYVKRRFSKPPRPITRRDTKPGEIMEVDFGYLGLTFDWETLRRRKTHVFSGRLRHSRFAYRAVVYDQTQETFFRCHIHAFEYFGGVPAKVVPDNLKAAVIRASCENPLVNRSYRMLAEHYGFTISPTLPYTPRHKGGVENDIKFIKNNFWPRFREKEKQKGRDIPHRDEIRPALEKWNAEVDERIIRGIGISPADSFREEEKNVLHPLPESRWEPVTWKECTVHQDWHIQFDKSYYSAPCAHVGAKVQVCVQSSIVRIFRDSEEIASHTRSIVPWQRRSREEHAPPNAREYLNSTNRGLLIRASSLGEPVKRVAENIFADRAVDGLRPVRALLGFAKKYSPERLNSACERALRFNTANYGSVKKILRDGLDIEDNRIAANSEDQEEFRFAREIGFFDPDNNKNQGGHHG